jgi:hypothetical protein
MLFIIEVGSNKMKKQFQRLERSGPAAWNLICTVKYIILWKVWKGLGNGQNILSSTSER